MKKNEIECWNLALAVYLVKTMFLIFTLLVILNSQDAEVAYNVAAAVGLASLIYSIIASLHLLKGLMETEFPLAITTTATILVLLSAPGLIFNAFIFTTTLAYVTLIVVDCWMINLLILRSKRNGKNKT